jgi:hypothetical protein
MVQWFSQPSDTLWIGRLAQLVNIPDFRLLEIKSNNLIG